MGALLFISFHLTLSAISALLMMYAWRRRYYRSGQPFAVLMGATAVWFCFRALAAAAPDPSTNLFWSLLQYAGIVTITPAWLLIAISYSGQWWRSRRLFQIGIFALPLVFFTLALTNDLHHMWWTHITVDASRGFLWPQAARGPFFWAHALYAYGCFAAGIFLLGRAVFQAAPIDRRHAWLMLLGALSPAIGNISYLTGVWTPWNDDPTPILVFIGGSLSFYATIHFRVIDLVPLVEREVLAALPDGIVVLNRQAMVSEINAEAIALLGLVPGPMIGRPLLSLIAGSPHLSDLRSILADGPAPRTHQVVAGEGAALQAIELRLRPLLAANGVRVGTLLLIRDVSERARIEQARVGHLAELSLINQVARAANTATETALLIRAISETIGAGGQWDRVAVGLTGAGGGRIDIVADYGAIPGRSYEGDLIRGRVGVELLSLMSAGHSSQFDLDDPAAASSLVVRAMQREGLRRALVVPLSHRGAPLGVLVMGSSVARPDSPVLIHLAETIGELITDAVVRTRLYEEVRAADQLKSSFLATVSHELRTPLTSIIGYIDMLRRGLYGPPGERMVEPLTYMRAASSTLLRLITDILDFSRMQAGQLKVDLSPTNPLHVIGNVVGQLQPQVRERGLELELELAEQLPLVQVNAVRLEQVLTNLIGNAIKFTEAGAIRVGARPRGDLLRISVRDTGIGIAAEDQEAIFQEFRRIDQADRHFGGAGLGLAISRRLIELMGGAIGVESALGVGSTFFIDLPVAAVPSDLPSTVMALDAGDMGAARSV